MTSTTTTLRESTSHVGSSHVLTHRLAEDGYLVLRGLLPREDVLEVRRAVLEVLADGWLAPRSPSDEARPRPGPAPSVEREPHWADTYADVLRLESLHRLAFSPPLLATMERLIGAPVLVEPTKVVRMVWPRIGTRAHQDFHATQSSGDSLTVWIPLGDCPREMGTLRVVPGSHRHGLIPPDSLDPSALPGRWASTDLRAGDVIIFHCLTIHGAPNNKTDRIRLSVDCRYQPANEPICEPWLAPHIPALAGHNKADTRWLDASAWDELTRGWSSRRWVTVPEGTGVVKILPLDAVREHPSRFTKRLSLTPGCETSCGA